MAEHLYTISFVMIEDDSIGFVEFLLEPWANTEGSGRTMVTF